MHLAGLKSITATHLALSAQSVSVILTQIPLLKDILLKHTQKKHHPLLSSFDRVAKDCEEHRREIFSKLIHIMTELIHNMLSERLSATSWMKHALIKAEHPTAPTVNGSHATPSSSSSNATAATTGAPSAPAPATAPVVESEDDPGLDVRSEEPDSCIKLLMKQTCSLYRALSDLLLTEHRDFIFKEIAAILLQNLEKLLQKVDMHNSIGSHRLHVNISHIITRLKTCQGSEESVKHMTDLVHKIKKL